MFKGGFGLVVVEVEVKDLKLVVKTVVLVWGWSGTV